MTYYYSLTVKRVSNCSKLYDTLTITQAVIFCNTRRKVDWLAEKMREVNFTVARFYSSVDFTESLIWEVCMGRCHKKNEMLLCKISDKGILEYCLQQIYGLGVSMFVAIAR